MRHLLLGTLLGMVMLPCVAGGGVTIVHDHFDGGALDPAWVVHLDEDPAADTWEYEVASSNLTVTDVTGAGEDEYCAVRLRRSCPLPGDFDLECAFSWDTSTEPESLSAMQRFRVSLIDTAGEHLAVVAYADEWIAYLGTIRAGLGGLSYDGGIGGLPHTGSATARITRSADTVRVFWDTDQLLISMQPAEIESLEISFWYYKYQDSFFGSESVDYVTVTAPESPVEATSWTRIKAFFRG